MKRLLFDCLTVEEMVVEKEIREFGSRNGAWTKSNTIGMILRQRRRYCTQTFT